MLKQNNHFKLTDREMDILNILWTTDKPLMASEISKNNSYLSINTVQAVLRNLLNKKLIEVAGITYSGTVLSRSYQASISSKDFKLQQFVNDFKNMDDHISTPSLVATLLEHEENEEVIIDELEKMLKERKRHLNTED